MLKLKNILFPTDFSNHATQALGYAATLAEAFDAQLTALHVVALFQDDPNNPMHHFPDLHDFYAGVESHASKRMDDLQTDFDKISIKKVTLRGISPAEEIVNFANTNRADLIVMGTHGRSAIGKFLLGSVTEKVVRHASCPVLTVSHHEKEAHQLPSLKSILVPLDFSEHSKGAIKYAVELAQTFGAHLDILHIADQRVHPAYYVMEEQSLFQVYPDLLKKSLSFLKDFVKDEIPQGLRYELFVREGNPHSEITKFAKKQNADLIVMATHGLSGLERLLIGSTTEKVVRKAEVPVLTIKSPQI